MPFYGNTEYWLIENENQSILLSFNIIARQVLNHDNYCYFKPMSRSHAMFSISWRASNCDKGASQASTNSYLDFDYTKGTVLVGTFPKY